jgi:hypothetical protein
MLPTVKEKLKYASESLNMAGFFHLAVKFYATIPGFNRLYSPTAQKLSGK